MPLRQASRFEAGAAFILAFVAGCVDAVGFSHLGGVFVSFMSGNTTRLGLHVVDADRSDAIVILGVIAGFVFGAAVGAMLATVDPRWRRVCLLAIEAAALLAALAFGQSGWRHGTACMMAFAMGLENEVFVTASGEARISLTFVSGTLVKLGEAIGRIVSGGPPFAWVRFFALWLALLAGVVTGGFGYARFGLTTLGAAALVVLALAVVFAIQDRHETSPD